MFRNQYDTDVTTWSPAGRLFQVEYAMEAVKQGSAAIGLRSKTHVVLACVNKANSELSSHQKKIFKVDDHIGVAIAGLTADGRVLSRYMRSECINHSFTYESPLPVGRLVVQLADKAQVSKQNPKYVNKGSEMWLVLVIVGDCGLFWLSESGQWVCWKPKTPIGPECACYLWWWMWTILAEWVGSVGLLDSELLE